MGLWQRDWTRIPSPGHPVSGDIEADHVDPIRDRHGRVDVVAIDRAGADAGGRSETD